MPPKAHPTTCRKCGYKWNTKSTNLYVTCPRCLRKTINPTDENLEAFTESERELFHIKPPRTKSSKKPR